MLEQVREHPIPVIEEHISFLPPIGYFTNGEIRGLDDGEQQIVFFGQHVDQFLVAVDEDPFERMPTVGRHPTEIQITAEASLEPRNFAPETWRIAQQECPVTVREESKWSALPPLEWLITIPVVWGAARFAGSFLDHLGDAAGQGLVNWIGRFAKRAKQSERESSLSPCHSI